MSKSNGNRSNGKTAPRAAEPIQLSLSKPEQGALREPNTQIAEVKLELANVTLQLDELDAKRRALCDQIKAAVDQYQGEIRAIARAKGLDVSQPISFDPVKMTISGTKLS